MAREEIRSALDNAWHEIGHAFAFVGEDRLLAAQNAVDSALESLKLVHDALDAKLQNRGRFAATYRGTPKREEEAQG